MKNQRILHIQALAVLLLMLTAVSCYPASGKKKLLLFTKNPATWTIIKNGATGKMIYCELTGVFTLAATGLTPRSLYTLVRYADAPPQVEILATRASDIRGALELSGVWRNWTKKFWLVPSEDVKGKVGDVGALVNWRPERYLFEEKSLGITCACPVPEEP